MSRDIKFMFNTLVLSVILMGILSFGLFVSEGNIIMSFFMVLAIFIMISLYVVMNLDTGIDYTEKLSFMSMVDKHTLIINHHKKYWDVVEWYISDNDVLYLAYDDKPKNDWHNHTLFLNDLDEHIVKYAMFDKDDVNELVINRV